MMGNRNLFKQITTIGMAAILIGVSMGEAELLLTSSPALIRERSIPATTMNEQALASGNLSNPLKIRHFIQIKAPIFSKLLNQAPSYTGLTVPVVVEFYRRLIENTLPRHNADALARKTGRSAQEIEIFASGKRQTFPLSILETLANACWDFGFPPSVRDRPLSPDDRSLFLALAHLSVDDRPFWSVEEIRAEAGISKTKSETDWIIARLRVGVSRGYFEERQNGPRVEFRLRATQHTVVSTHILEWPSRFRTLWVGTRSKRPEDAVRLLEQPSPLESYAFMAMRVDLYLKTNGLPDRTLSPRTRLLLEHLRDRKSGEDSEGPEFVLALCANELNVPVVWLRTGFTKKELTQAQRSLMRSMTLAQFVRVRRRIVGLTPKDCNLELAASAGYVHQLESGKIKTVGSAQRLAALVKVLESDSYEILRRQSRQAAFVSLNNPKDRVDLLLTVNGVEERALEDELPAYRATMDHWEKGILPPLEWLEQLASRLNGTVEELRGAPSSVEMPAAHQRSESGRFVAKPGTDTQAALSLIARHPKLVLAAKEGRLTVETFWRIAPYSRPTARKVFDNLTAEGILAVTGLGRMRTRLYGWVKSQNGPATHSTVDSETTVNWSEVTLALFHRLGNEGQPSFEEVLGTSLMSDSIRVITTLMTGPNSFQSFDAIQRALSDYLQDDDRTAHLMRGMRAALMKWLHLHSINQEPTAMRKSA